MQQTIYTKRSSDRCSYPFLDGTVHVETYGNPKQPSILLLHGLAQSGRCWRKQIGSLSQHYHLIIPDLPGHGLTPIESFPGLTPTSLADLIHELLTFYDPERKGSILIGWSWGATLIKSYFLTRGKNAVRGLVLIGTSFDMQSYQEQPEVQVAMASFGQMLFSPDPDARSRALLQFHNQLTYRPLGTDDYYLTLGYNARCFLQHGLRPELMQPLEDVQQRIYNDLPPTLIVQGEQDALCHVAIGRQEHIRIRDSQYLEYEKCGHSPFLEYSTRFNTDIQQWISTLDLRI